MRIQAKRAALLLCSSFIFIYGAGNVLGAPAEPAPARPNLLLITLDTLRADRVSCYDPSHVQTPAIDALARRGVRFSRAYAHNPLTLPSHVNILLGTTPLRHGVHNNGHFVVPPEELTLAEHLKAAGYRTAAFVSASTLDSRFGLDQGFELYDDDFMPPGAPKTTEAEQRAGTAVGKALAWLEKAPPEGWFLWLHLYDPHLPYDPPEPYKSRFKGRPYEGEVAYTDAELGRLFAALERLGLPERTVIVLTGDHGESLGDHGEISHRFLAYNPTIWIPLVIALPGQKPLLVDEPVCHADIVPTVCELLGVSVPPDLHGTSLRPLLQGKALPPRPVYFESLDPFYSYGWAPLVGFLDRGEKFIDSPIPELYRLAEDPGENRNLAGTADLGPYRAKLGELIDKLTAAGTRDARAKINPELKRQLESLGYLSAGGASRKQEYGPEDDVKTRLPHFNRIEGAYALKDQGRRGEAVRRLEALVNEAATLDMAYVRLAELYADAGSGSRAVEVLEKGWARFPRSYEIPANLAENLLALDRPDRVVEVIREAQKSLPIEQDAGIWNTEGVAFLKLGNPRRALESFERAVHADAEFVDALYNLGSTALALALETKAAGDFATAVEALERATSLDPENPDAWNSLGAAQFSANRPEKAVLAWERVLALDPARVRTNYFLGTAYLGLGDSAKAVFHLRAYKDIVYSKLGPEEKRALDALLEKARSIKR